MSDNDVIARIELRRGGAAEAGICCDNAMDALLSLSGLAAGMKRLIKEATKRYELSPSAVTAALTSAEVGDERSYSGSFPCTSVDEFKKTIGLED